MSPRRLAFDHTPCRPTNRACVARVDDRLIINAIFYVSRWDRLGTICPNRYGPQRPSIIATTAGQRLASGGPRIFETFVAIIPIPALHRLLGHSRSHQLAAGSKKGRPDSHQGPLSWRTEDQDQRRRETKFAPIGRASSRVPMQAGGAADGVIGAFVLLAR